jgi:hypothetical protein
MPWLLLIVVLTICGDMDWEGRVEWVMKKELGELGELVCGLV